mmetsp:Transcript_79849/g.171133  ORF Transcript_79849/g.171133 Transcript_79849/m.171133 type:complete len:323 (-) Transcript_79849:7-975(-)
MPSAPDRPVAAGDGISWTPPSTTDGVQLAAFRQRPAPNPSQEEVLLLQQRLQVHHYQQEVLGRHFRRWVLTFSFVLCLMLPAMLGLFIWMVISYARESSHECDVPLRLWVIVVCSNVGYHTNFCGAGSLHTVLLKLCCRYDSQERENTRPVPWYVRLYNVFVTLAIFIWHCIGLHWIRTSTTCEATSPHLFLSVRVFASFSIVFNIFVYVNTVGLYTIMMFMLRNGMLRTDDAAPEGTLDQQSVVKFDAELFKDNKECCICIAEFDDKSEIRRTYCGHCFHSKCLTGWLKVNHTCPLCRSDLTVDSKVACRICGVSGSDCPV